MGEETIKLCRSETGKIIVRPRWPYRYVHISPNAYDKLIAAQAALTVHDIKIALTRGYENEGTLLKILHRFGRCMGALMFLIIFPWRFGEIRQIFSANGHNANGNHIDVGIMQDTQQLNLLPCGVFTINLLRETAYIKHQDTINKTWETLRSCGFAIHPNQTEAMQIHCDC